MGRSLPLPARFARPLLPATIIALGLVLFAAAAGAQVVINEILPNPNGDDVGTERIEIYNAGANPVDMTGWAIDDAATIDQAAVRCRIPEDFDIALCPGSVVIGPGEFRVLKGTSTAAFLNNTGDDVYLVSNRTVPATVVHFVHYPSAGTQVDSVWAALPNGSANFAWRGQSMCASNGNTGDVTPPAAVVNLAAVPGAFPGEIRLTWTAPGDDGTTGTATSYTIKVAHTAITSGTFDAAADVDRWIGEPLPSVAATPETLFVFGLAPDSTWFFAIETQDEVPNTSTISNSPGTAPLAGTLLNPDLGYTPYFGNLHSHTGYSDGVQTPPDAYNFARNIAPTPLDFLAVTDHNHVSAGMSLPNYALGLSQADAANSDGNFVAIYGQEWGLAANGHVNIYQAPVLFGWDPGNYNVFVAEGDYASLYTATLANPPASYPVVLEWAHPGLSDFNNYQLTNDGRAAVHLMALVNGPATSTATDESDIGNTGFDAAFQQALKLGFRVSPTADQDNHNATWGASSQSRTAVLANAKTRSAILTAMAARRTYATQDHNTVVKFSAEGHAMGEAFTASQGVRIAVQITDPDASDAVAQIDLFRGITGTSIAARIAGSVGNPSFNWRDRQVLADGTEAHYYLRVRMADNQSIWTGPVYVTYQGAPPAAVGDQPPGGGQLALYAHPNPTQGNLTAEFTLARDETRVTLAIYDLAGRLRRTLVRGPLPAGPHHVVWDGLDEHGERPGAGVFFLRLNTSAGRIERKVLTLR